MMKVCLNCQTENSLDAVFCSQCGMSLTGAPSGEKAVKAREGMERARSAIPPAPPRPGRRMRRTARILALVSAGCWTLLLISTPGLLEFIDDSLAVFGARQPGTFSQLTGWGSWAYVVIAVLVLGSWAVAVIPWRWEAVGGVLLVLWAGLLLPIGYDLLLSAPLTHEPWDAVYTFATCFPSVFLLTLPAGLWGLIAGSLFLARWRKSRTPGSRQAST